MNVFKDYAVLSCPKKEDLQDLLTRVTALEG